jgi:hypothetical protein
MNDIATILDHIRLWVRSVAAPRSDHHPGVAATMHTPCSRSLIAQNQFRS